MCIHYKGLTLIRNAKVNITWLKCVIMFMKSGTRIKSTLQDWRVWSCLWSRAPGWNQPHKTEGCDHVMKSGTRIKSTSQDWRVWSCLWSRAPGLKSVIMFMKSGTRTLPLSGTASETTTEGWIEHTSPSPMLADGWLQLQCRRSFRGRSEDKHCMWTSCIHWLTDW